MAITAEQAAQLASTYQAGDTSGLQGLVSSMGVTAGDVAQYFPGFDVGSLQGVTLAPSAPVAPAAPAAPLAPPAPTYGTQKFTGDVISNFIKANLESPELIAQKAKEFGLSASDIQKAAGYTPEQQARYLSMAGVTPTGITGLTPLAYGDKGQFTAKEVLDYVNANIADPTRIYQAAQQYKVTPEQLQSLYTGSATPYGLSDIQKYFETGKTGFGDRYQDIVESTIGSTDYLTKFEQNRANIERSLGLDPGALKSTYNVKDFSNKSIEEIEKALQQSGANRYQEADFLSNVAKNAFGFTDEQAKALRTDLLKGNKVDENAKKFYNELLTEGYSKNLETKMLQDAAVRAPNSPFFKENPGALAIYTPIGEKKSVGENSNQYGLDPKTGLPFIHLGAIKNTMGDDVFVRPFREERGQGELGYHPHSAWAGFITNGVGLFGVKASQSDINYFDKIEKEIAKLGGIRTETNEEGQVYNYVNVPETDPETGQKYTRKVGIESFFAQPEEDTKQTRTYQEYRNTQDALRTAASKAGVPETKYTSTKQAYEDLNNRFKDLYVIQGRTDTLDPAAAKTLGIPDVKDNKKHATLLYQAVGDKLVPQKVLNVFDYKDPNTTKGFFGDLAQSVASVPFLPELATIASGGTLTPWYPAMKGAQAAALGAKPLDIAKTVALAYAAPQITKGIGSLMTDALPVGTPALIQEALTKGIASGVITGLSRGDLDKIGESMLAGTIGSAASSGIPTLLKDMSVDVSPNVAKGIAELVGGTAATAITGQNPEKYAINRLLTFGLGQLAEMGAEKAGIPTKGTNAELLKAMAPIIANKKVTDKDVLALANVVKNMQTVQG